MGMSVGESKGGAMAEMNVVPLIDILLVLLIIFMVITPLTPHGLDALVPQPNPNQKQDIELENKTVGVQVLSNNKLKINNEDTTWDGLGPRLETIFKERASSSVRCLKSAINGCATSEGIFARIWRRRFNG